MNNSGDLVTAPSIRNLPPGNRDVYCIDGHPHFPQELDTETYYIEEPDFLLAEFEKILNNSLYQHSVLQNDDMNTNNSLEIHIYALHLNHYVGLDEITEGGIHIHGDDDNKTDKRPFTCPLLVTRTVSAN